MARMSRKQFEGLVEEAVATLPEPFRSKAANVIVLVEDEPEDEDYDETDTPDDEELLGVFRGRPLTDSHFDDLPDMPPQVVVFRGPILRCTDTKAEAIREIQDTVVHELGHYFGLDDDEMPY